MAFQHQIVVNEDERKTLTVYIPGEKPLVIDNETDPAQFGKAAKLAAVGSVRQDRKRMIGLMSPAASISDRFNELSDRVAVRAGKLFFDGDELHNSLAEHTVRCLEDEGSWKPLVNFIERVHMNPSQVSRNSLYDWLNNRFTINEDGNIIMYKGVNKNGKDTYQSVHSGHAIVDGKEYKNSQIPQKVGSVVTIPRSEVDENPSASCSTGLHAARHGFAKTFAGSNTTCLKIEVDPRDVVSVPAYDRDKVRVCRYKVVGIATAEDARPIAREVVTHKVTSDTISPKKVQTKGDGVKTQTRDALRKIAARLGIEGRGSMSKDQLEKAVAKHSVAALNRDELRKEAARLNIDGRGRMNKEQLQVAVANAR